MKNYTIHLTEVRGKWAARTYEGDRHVGSSEDAPSVYRALEEIADWIDDPHPVVDADDGYMGSWEHVTGHGSHYGRER